MRASKLVLQMLAALAFVPHAPCARADDAISREDQFKAAYLFNFLKFVDWPAGTASDVLTVCFVGASGVEATLATGLESKRAGARRLAIRRIEPNASLQGCNVLYIDANALPMRSSLATQSTLTVSDATDFAQRGGIIELFTENKRLRFDINIDNAQKAGLRISSSLLQLAAQVRRGET